MTVITLTTVGYGEVIPIQHDPILKTFTIFLIVTGMGAVLYFVSSMTAFIVDGELRDYIRKKRMSGMIEDLEDHFIIAGTGETGHYVLTEMVKSRRPCVVVDTNLDAINSALEALGKDIPYIVGDATEDEILREAGIERASGVVFSLGNDRDNLFATITARRLGPDLRIVTRGEDPRAEQKFLMAGATSVIYTNVLGGMRMAAEVVRPEVTTFLDIMMRDHGEYRSIEELGVPEGSSVVGMTVRDLNIREKADALIIAVHEGDDYHFNPGPEYKFKSGSKLIVLALLEDIPKIERLLRRGR